MKKIARCDKIKSEIDSEIGIRNKNKNEKKERIINPINISRY